MFNFFKSKLQKDLDNHVKSMLYENENILTGLNSSVKTKLKDDLFNLISTIEKTNKISKFRELFTESVLYYTDLQVVCLTEEEKKVMHFANEKKISGTLYKTIKECLPLNNQTINLLNDNPNLTDKECLDYSNTISAMNNFHMNGLNLLRLDIGDYSEKVEDDWFLPFVTSMLIFSEDTIRRELKLNKLYDDDESPSIIAHSTFKNYVCDNLSKNPYLTWKQNNNEYLK